MTSYLNLGYRDYDAEASTARFPILDVNDTNFEATKGMLFDLVAALIPITNGALRSSEILSSDIDTAANPAASQLAQRERKWLISIRPSLGGERNFSIEVGCADLTLLRTVPPRRNEMDKALPEYDALRNAIAGFVRSPEGQTVGVVNVVHVGRNT